MGFRKGLKNAREAFKSDFFTALRVYTCMSTKAERREQVNSNSSCPFSPADMARLDVEWTDIDWQSFELRYMPKGIEWCVCWIKFRLQWVRPAIEYQLWKNCGFRPKGGLARRKMAPYG